MNRRRNVWVLGLWLTPLALASSGVFAGVVLIPNSGSTVDLDALGDPPGDTALVDVGVAVSVPDGNGVAGTEGWSLTNRGRIETTAGGHNAIHFIQNSGTVDNQGGTIAGAGEGIHVAGDAADITNSGAVTGGSCGIRIGSGIGEPPDFGPLTAGEEHSTGLFFAPGGMVTNSQGGTIDGLVGVGCAGDDDMLINAGAITGTGGTAVDMGGGDDVVILQAGSSVTGDIDGGGGIDAFELNDAGSYGGDVLGFESLIKTGAGLWTLSGDCTTGATTVSQGTLAVEGNLAGTVTVSSGAALAGGGTIIGGLTNHGTIAPGSSVGTMTVGGDWLQPADGTLEVEVEPGGACDRLAVTGAATLAGGTVRPVPIGGACPAAARYTIVTAGGGVSGTFDRVDYPSSAVLGFSLDYGEPNQVGLLFSRNSYRSLGATPNQRNVGAALDEQVGSAGGEMRDLLDAMDAMDLAGVRGMLEGLNPAVYDSLTAVTLRTATRTLNTLHRRFDGRPVPPPAQVSRRRGWLEMGPQLAFAGSNIQALRIGLAAGGQPVEAEARTEAGADLWSVWAQGMANWAREKHSRDHVGYRYATGGGMLGLEYRLAPELAVGLAFGLAESHVRWNDSTGKGDITSASPLLYAACARKGFYARAAAGAGFDWYHNDRRISAWGRRAHATHRGYECLLHLGGGYDFHRGGWTFGPAGRVQYVHLYETGFTEHGAGAAGVKIGSRHSNSVQTALGGRISYTFRCPDTDVRLQPRFRAEWVHEYQDHSRKMTAAFLGAPDTTFYVRGDSPPADSVVLGPELWIRIGENVSGYVSYDLWLRADEQLAHSLTAGVKVDF
jgi:outer membrane autotransporter protein